MTSVAFMRNPNQSLETKTYSLKKCKNNKVMTGRGKNEKGYSKR